LLETLKPETGPPFTAGYPDYWPHKMSVILETSVGDITIDLHLDECPKTCLNFLKLCKVKYYNNVIFHNIQKDYIVQTGDPNGDGKGGESVFGFVCVSFSCVVS
jgi:cyclophilin family peptidyl-prolyl cis-trans isomerase